MFYTAIYGKMYGVPFNSFEQCNKDDNNNSIISIISTT